MALRSNVIALEPLRARTRGASVARLSPEDMLLFATVAREGGIRSGAQALRTPRSTLSRRLVELERALGGQLVVRSTRKFALTELGTALLVKCEQLEELLRSTADVTERAAREPTGLLRIAASPIVGEEFLPAVLDEYLRRFPLVRVAVELSVSFVDLAKGAVDVAIRNGPLTEKGDLYASRLGLSVKGHYASPGYLARSGTPQIPEDLVGHECVVIGDGTRPVAWALRSRGAELHVSVSGRVRVNSQRLARSAAAAGMGIARLPTVFAQPLVESGELVPLLEKHWPSHEIFAVHAAGHPAPPKIRAFIDLLRTAMRRHLPER